MMSTGLTFCILAVFLLSFFLASIGRQLFVPLSLAAAFAMIASFLLSSSLVPVLSTWIMQEKKPKSEQAGSSESCTPATRDI